ncbi:MAG: MBL fold metallo-hydrolase [Clostridia bacterium]|nr:MBL fold metallo-hydrolase [Clostridia bacterium]
MKITFLGTADVRPRIDAYVSATMIEVGDAVYLLDAGAPVSDLMLRYGRRPDELRAVFTTHAHNDHVDGLLQLFSHCIHIYPKASYEVFMTEEPIARAFCDCIGTLYHMDFPKERLHVHIAAEGVVYDDGVLRATYIPVAYNEGPPHFAILIEAEGRRVLFTGDMSQDLKDDDFPRVAYECETDLIVCEYAHTLIDRLDPCLKQCRTRMLAFNHYAGYRHEELAAIVNSGKYAFPIRALRDGDVIELNGTEER